MIPFFDYRPALREIRDEIDDAIRRVLDSGHLILGPEVEALETEFASRVGVSSGVGVNSGTDALILALRALDIGSGDEVLTVANAGVPTVAAIRAVGATPVFVDVEPDTLLMDPSRLDAALSERTRCVLPVHLYGRAAELEAIVAFARERGLSLIEDCAQAHGTDYEGRPVGGFGDIGCFSFYPTKNLGALGDGGLCVTPNDELAARLRELRQYGFRADRHAHREGLNSRLDELQAAILRVKLRRLDGAVARRREIAAAYREGLAGSSLDLLALSPDGGHAYHLFVVRAGNRGRVTDTLDGAGVGYGIHYPEPVHLMEAYRFLGYRDGDLPETETACREVLSLPLYPGLDEDRLQRVIDVLRGET